MMACEIRSSNPISCDESSGPSQEFCSYCNKSLEIKLCACKRRIQCIHCENWWMKPYETDSNSSPAKKPRLTESTLLNPNLENSSGNPFEELHDDLTSYLLSRVGVTATSPHDLLNLRLVCKRFKRCMDPWGLANISGKIIRWIRANWSERSQDFLTRGADAGSPEACYSLGMMCFYFMGDQRRGTALIEKAAKNGHAAAFYSLALIHFRRAHTESDHKLQTGEGSTKCTHFVCTKWAQLGRLDALREMGFNLDSDPHFSSPNNLYALRESTLEFMAKTEGKTHVHNCQYHRDGSILKKLGFEWGLGKEVLEVRKFIDGFWKFDSREGWDGVMSMCSNLLCGRKERKGDVFKRCDSCGTVFYCSTACQEMHLKMKHYEICGSEWRV